MKDIFIDTTIAVRFCNPLENSYKRLLRWLIKYDKDNLTNNAYIVVSNKLLSEYKRSFGNSSSGTSIIVILDKMQREGRKINISNQQISCFRRKYLSKRRIRCLRCNFEDWNHIPVILLSNRKYALSTDNNLVYDINNFPGFLARAECNPDDLPYEE